jgi:hypothetical protein
MTATEDRYRHAALAKIPNRVDAVSCAQHDLEVEIARALHWGATWAQIATALGVTRQTAHQRYRRLRYDPRTGITWHEPPLPL